MDLLNKIRGLNLKHLHLLLLISLVFSLRAQERPPVFIYDSLNTCVFNDLALIDSATYKKYPFIQFNKNHFQFYTPNSPNWEHFYDDFQQMVQKKDRKLNFYHIGGSHIQADIYTHDFRTFLQSHWKQTNGERGYVFPFDLAHTNNPGNYEFSSPNVWKGFKSVNHRPVNLEYGVLGAALTCNDSLIQIKFKHDRTIVAPPINVLRILHNKGNMPFELNFGNDEILVYKTEQNLILGYTDIFFTDPINSIDLQFVRTTSEILDLEIYGFLMMNEAPGISYNSIGINGAGLYTYLENKNFEEQLHLYPPDFFAFSVGTNDANVPYEAFDPQIYKQNLERMMKKVLNANPNCAMLLTVPNDSYYHRKYLNRNIARQREVIIELAEKYQMAVWDFYGIMGELGASKLWFQHGLMQADFIHFTFTGYHLKGDLLIDAFIKFLDQMNQRETTKKHLK